MVPLNRALVSSYRLSIVTMSLSAVVWPQFATQVFRRGIGRLTCIGSYVNKQVTTFTFRAQATTCSKHHTWTVMDAGCECAPWVRSANPSDSWALVCNCCSSCSDSLYCVVSAALWHTHVHLFPDLCVLYYFVLTNDSGGGRSGSPVGNVVGRISEVNQRRTRLVIGWVTVCRRVNHLCM